MSKLIEEFKKQINLKYHDRIQLFNDIIEKSKLANGYCYYIDVKQAIEIILDENLLEE